MRRVGRLRQRHRESPEYELYASFVDDHPIRRCWHCGATKKPRWWYGPWMLERAHIVNKPRAEDRRAVIILCSTCHQASHGARFQEYRLSRLDVEGLIELKRRFDPEFFDPEFLQRHSVVRLYFKES